MSDAVVVGGEEIWIYEKHRAYSGRVLYNARKPRQPEGNRYAHQPLIGEFNRSGTVAKKSCFTFFEVWVTKNVTGDVFLHPKGVGMHRCLKLRC